jgi:electron transport complex protein RnfD
MAKRIISWHIPASMRLLFLIAALFHAISHPLYPALTCCPEPLSGAFFIATDYVTSASKSGQIIFGIGVGLSPSIRNFAGYPEGMAFAVLLMNSLTPIIDQYTRPRATHCKGEPPPLEEAMSSQRTLIHGVILGASVWASNASSCTMATP